MRKSRTVRVSGSYDRTRRRAEPRKPVPVEGAPKIGKGQPWVVAADGGMLWTARGTYVEAFRLTRGADGATAEQAGQSELPGAVVELAASPVGSVFAIAACGQDGFEIFELGDRGLRHIGATASPRHVVVTRTAIVTVEPGDGESGARTAQLVTRDLRRGKLLRRIPLASRRVSLRAGTGDSVVVVEGGGRLRYIDASRAADDCRDPCDPGCRPLPNRIPPRQPDTDDISNGHHKISCCCPPKPTAPKRPRPIDPLDSTPSGGASGRPSRDPDGQCVPGDDGVPDRCWITKYVGAKIIRINICDPDEPPCGTTIAFQPARLQQTRSQIVAQSADGRRLVALDARSLRQTASLTLPSGSQAVALAALDEIVLLSPDGGLALFPTAPAVAELELATATSSVFSGENPATQYSPYGRQVGMRTVMIVPVLEPGQNYSGTTADMAEYYEMENILSKVQDFYTETSYDDPPDHDGIRIRFLWFGADTPEVYTGQPVRLGKPFKDYWGPAWDPGHIRATITVPGGSTTTIRFSGDERLVINCVPSPVDTYDELEFTLRFPAGSFRSRIPNNLPSITFEAAMPSRSITLIGSDREGNSVNVNVDTRVLSDSTVVSLTRTALGAGPAELDALADVLKEMLDSGAPGMFERPSVLWHDDEDETGMLHVAVSFADGSGSQVPELTAFDIDDLLSELDPSSRPGTFVLPGDESLLQTYLRRVITDAHVRHPEFGPRLAESYFDLDDGWQAWVRADGNDVETRINLSTKHGQDPAVIELVSHDGLDQLGFDSPFEGVGADTTFSGGGGPKFEDDVLFDEVYTAMIDATIDLWGDEAAAIDAINERFNCEGLEEFPLECAFDLIHNVVVTPVYPGPAFAGTTQEPDLVKGERAAAWIVSMDDLKAEQRVKPVRPIGANRLKVIMKLAPNGPSDPDRAASSAGTLAHELGHSLLGLPDLYSGGKHRANVTYMGSHCIMGATQSFSHYCAYNKRIKRWLDDDAILPLDRPIEGDIINQEVILVQLEYWEPTFGEAWDAIAQTALPGASPDTPVVAAVFLRLGGDGRQFNIVELRGQGPQFSADLLPSRIVISNAIDPEDDTRYAEGEVENAGVTEEVLERYRRKVHLLSSGLRQATIGTPEATYDFASDQEFPEVGLTATLLEWGTGATSAGSFDMARINLRWERGAAINLGFKDATPDWQSPDIAILRPGEFPENGEPDFPENQDDLEGFRSPPKGAEPLSHKIGVRVWNFGDAPALHVQVGLVRRPSDGGGGGDWEEVAELEKLIDEPVEPEGEGGPSVVFFDWNVEHGAPEHLCFRAQIGDRDVPRDNNGNALASDDTDHSNRWAQQNVFNMDAASDSPPDPVEFTFEVNNRGSYVERVSVVPIGLDAGAEVTITPARMEIAPRSRGFFRVRAVLEERLLNARCGKDIDFRLQALREEDHAQENWGSSRYVLQPRLRTKTTLNGGILPEQLKLSGQVSPDVGAMEVLLQIERPGQPTLWERVPLGPNSTFDFVIDDSFPANVEVTAVAYFDGSLTHSKSASEPVVLAWQVQG
ncbi:MAG: hypothetical protein QNJ30_13250 [Kiloniellales bacterium]|nr:hypothetical protein [Kiloniellales bacterium]